MNWSAITLGDNAKLFKSHQFTYILKGVVYQLEVDEYSDGTFSGHGEHSTDRSHVLESVSGKSVEDCLSLLIAKVPKD